MDRVLAREEAKELLGLLGLPPTCWGNMPLMKKKLREARIKYHPDKGGDNQTMARLNDLWAKAQAKLESVHESDPGFFSGPVSFFWDSDYPTLGEMLGPLWGSKIKRNSHCVVFGMRACTCITCVLGQIHQKKLKAWRRPITWGECYCFNCYLVWFGLRRDWAAHYWWSCILFNSTMDELGLWGKITLY
ncbi:small t antigen [Bovine polyomavirus 3]|uniref:small t antigen n=1 Tax=Bovine polyomavirus 3 TaxID=1561705 RepID=UPI00052104E9|nr:small t antigen [Bovine polyomavirus 3]AIT68769.1 small t antigen [Bovine polyomavirus 3]